MQVFEEEESSKSREIAINVTGVWKEFRLAHERSRTIKELFLKRKRASYEDFWALKDVSFEVREGDTFGIIGENGSGKSTMLKLLTRILSQDKGKIEVIGKVSALLELGAGFHPELTGRENIYLNGSILGLPKCEIDRKFDDIVSFAELERFIDIPVKSYSSGMYVRLGFAVAVSAEPDVLIIDEVLAVGDEAFQRKCLDQLYKLRAEDKTIVFVSHELEAVKNFCNKVMWLHEGEVKSIGKASNVIGDYLREVNSKVGEEAGSRIDELGELVGSRWGSKEIEIVKVDFMGDDNKKTHFFKTGSTLKISLEYNAKEKIKNPVFGIAIYGSDGVLITGPNSKTSGQVIENVYGNGQVVITLERLSLLPGRYFFSVAVYDHDCLHPFDHHEKMYIVDVIPSGELEPRGFMQLRPLWRYYG